MMTEQVTISQTDLRKLLSVSSPDAALLYLYLQGGNSLETASKELNMNELRLNCAAAVLRQMKLLSENAPTHTPIGERPNYSYEDIIKVGYDYDFVTLRKDIEERLKRSINNEGELKILLGIYHYLGLPSEVISILVNHCVKRAERQGKSKPPSLYVIEKEAHAWAERGIDTFEEATAYAQMQEQRDTKIGKLMRVLQIYGRNLTAAETRYANNWLDMGMEEGTIAMAYERTCLNTGGLNWAYMNKILQRWHSQGLHTPEEVHAGDQKPNSNATGQRQLDADEVAAIRRMMEGN